MVLFLKWETSKKVEYNEKSETEVERFVHFLVSTNGCVIGKTSRMQHGSNR